MPTLSDVVRAAGPGLLAQHRSQLLPSQARALRNILDCRTPRMGGRLFCCPRCARSHPVYHSCRNRFCPVCQRPQGDAWIDHQRQLLLPTEYLLITCTLPEELRLLARSHQRAVYSVFMREAAGAVLDAVADRRFVGGRAAILSVLQTWARSGRFHPHVHMLVPAGGLAIDDMGPLWRKPRKRLFPIPGYAVAARFRVRLRTALAAAGLVSGDEPVFRKRFVANVRRVGDGAGALLYLSRYLFRPPMADRQLDAFDGERVTLHWTESKSRATRRETLPVHQFLGRFLQHVLPRGFTRVRYYGLWAPTCRRQLEVARTILEHSCPRRRRPLAPARSEPLPAAHRCPNCGAVLDEPPRLIPRERAPPSCQ